jgi:hypothetical protein
MAATAESAAAATSAKTGMATAETAASMASATTVTSAMLRP